MKKLFLVVCFIFCSVLLYADLSITPAIVNVLANDAAVCEGAYTVFNTADVKTTVKLSVEDWKSSSQNSSDVTAEKWLKLYQSEIEIEPKATVEEWSVLFRRWLFFQVIKTV